MLGLLVALILLGDPTPCLTLAHAEVESGYVPSVYRKHPGKSVFFCGLWQTMALTRRDCDRMRFSVTYALETRTKEWGAWMRACKGNVTCALGGYGCGWFGAKHPSKCGVRGGKSYPFRVLSISKTCSIHRNTL